MSNMLKGFWRAICGFAKAAWGFLTTLLSAAIDFIEGVFESLIDFFDALIDGIIDLVELGVAKLWEIMFPPDITDEPDLGPLGNFIQNEIDKKNAQGGTPVSISELRLAVKTGTNGKLKSEDDIKAFFVTGGSSMGGLDDRLKQEGGIVEIKG